MEGPRRRSGPARECSLLASIASAATLDPGTAPPRAEKGEEPKTPVPAKAAESPREERVREVRQGLVYSLLNPWYEAATSTGATRQSDCTGGGRGALKRLHVVGFRSDPRCPGGQPLEFPKTRRGLGP